MKTKGKRMKTKYGKRVANKHEKKPIVGYMNITHLGNKIDALREICAKSPIDIVCIVETKFDSSFSDSQLLILGFHHFTRTETRMEEII